MDQKMKSEYQRWHNHHRFRWHEAVLKDRVVQKCPSAIALAGHIMHRYSIQHGCAQFSIGSAEKALGYDERTLKRARKLLRELGWIRPDTRPRRKGPGGWRANRYFLGGGPDDLLFDNESDGDGNDTTL